MNKKVKSLIIILIVLIVLGGGFFAGIRYYNGVKEFGYQSKIYYEDSFSNDQANSIRLINPQGDKTKIIPGEKVGFEINFKNNGTLQVSYFKITLKVPEHLKFTDDIQTQYKYVFNKAENEIIFNIGTLDGGSGGQIKISLQAQTPLINGLFIESPKVKFDYFKESRFLNLNANLSKDISDMKEKIIVSSNPDFNNSFIKISTQENIKNDNGQIEIKKKDILNLFVFVFNRGTMDAENVKIKVKELEGLIISEPSEGIAIENGEINMTIPEIKTSGNKTLKFSATIDPGIENNHIFSPTLTITYSNMEIKKETGTKAIIKLFPDLGKSKISLADSNGGDTYAGEILNVSAQITNNGDIAANNVSANLVLSNVFKAYLGETKWQFDEIKSGASVSVSTQLQVTENISKDIVSAIQMAIKADNADKEFTINSNSIKIYYTRPFTGTSIPIVALHGIEPFAAGRWETSNEKFDYLCGTLKASGYQTITLADLRNYFAFGKALPEKPVILTSDDGYQSVYTNAFPILKKYGYKMTVFLIDGYIGNSEAERRLNDFDKNEKSVVTR
ncbi:MAG: polysaccharide deacetylase family protein, partial [Candidatus Humimicrobiaceae bacterium]